MRLLGLFLGWFLAVAHAGEVSAADNCYSELTAENIVGNYLLVLGDMSIEDGMDPDAFHRNLYSDLSNKAIWLPLTAQTMEARIANEFDTIFLTDGNYDVEFNITEDADRDILLQSYVLFADLRDDHKERFRDWNGETTPGSNSDYAQPCHPATPTYFRSKTTNVSGVIFTYYLFVLSHSEDSTIMVGKLLWVGVNGVRSVRQAMLLRGQFAEEGYWSEQQSEPTSQ